MNADVSQRHPAKVLVAPVHLKGAQAIADCFWVSTDTVAVWAKKGAPFVLVGKKYQGEYNSIMTWLLAKEGPFYAKNDHS